MDQLQQHAKAGKSARLPSFVNDLACQAPPAGIFSAKELLWSKVRHRGGMCNVVAIPKDRIHDFVGGKNERGNTTINMEVKSSQQCPGVPTSLVGWCCYGKLRETAQKEKAATPITQVDGRRSKISMGQSIKKGCLYAFTIKESSRKEGMVIIKFMCDDGGQCSTMEHADAAGNHVHMDLTMHVPHTDEVKAVILARLKAGACTKTVLKGALLNLHNLKELPAKLVELMPTGRPFNPAFCAVLFRAFQAATSVSKALFKLSVVMCLLIFDHVVRLYIPCRCEGAHHQQTRSI
jgi:hypothetical protein